MWKNARSEIFNDSKETGHTETATENDRPLFFFIFFSFLRLKNIVGIFSTRDLRQNCYNPRFNIDIYIEPVIRSWIIKFSGSLVQSTLVKLSLYSMKCGETCFANRLLMLNLLHQLCKLAAGTSAQSTNPIYSIILGDP